jgi:hypothetical protein
MTKAARERLARLLGGAEAGALAVVGALGPPGRAEVVVGQLDVGPDEPVILGGDPGQPAGGRLGADEAEQPRARLGAGGTGRPVGDRRQPAPVVRDSGPLGREQPELRRGPAMYPPCTSMYPSWT